jgi:SH3 domain-containing YSC84-like protein 1
MKTLRIALMTALLIPAWAAQKDTEKRLTAAADTMNEVMGTPDKSIPQDLLNKAECAIVIPDLKKGAFIIGAKYGRGFAICRNSNDVGWGSPAAVRLEGGSFGFQIGGAETDVVMLVMNKGGMKKLLTSKFTLGGDASVAAGPVGRDSSAQTDAFMNAEILTWSRQRGVFAGIALTGATLREDGDTNADLYGQTRTNKDILGGTVPAPGAATQLIALLNKYSSRK